MRHGSLFSGIGGFDLAAEWMGWENVFHCEWNEFGQKVLKHYWPEAISYGDITKTDFTIHRGGIDILSGGFPCQPFSMAGKRKGTADDRHLWPEMLRAIREIQPAWVIGENVSGLINWDAGLVFDQVQADLEAEGYEVTPFLLPACGVNAPHKRERVWFIGYSKHNGLLTAQKRRDDKESSVTPGENQVRESPGADSVQSGVTPNCNCIRKYRSRKEGERWIQFKNGGSEVNSDPTTQRLQRRSDSREIRERGTRGEQRLENVGSLSGKNWGDFPTQPPIRSGNDGVPSGLVGITVPKHRNESIKAYGNAIVPQVVFQIFKAIEKYETNP